MPIPANRWSPVSLALAALMCCGGPALATDRLLQAHEPSLTTYLPSSATSVQDVRPLHGNRGVHLDGTLREEAPLGWAVAANPFGEDWNKNNRMGAIRLDLGAYAPHEVDLSLPSQGIRWEIGRTYNPLQRDAQGLDRDSNGPQGWNWFQSSQPELVLAAGATAADDVLYLVYGADRYIEFARVSEGGQPTDTFRAVNGAAGVVVIDAVVDEPDLATYFDQTGLETTFFGLDSDAVQDGVAGQLWRIVRRGELDAATTDDFFAYVGDRDDPVAAAAAGYDLLGRMVVAYDPAGRKYDYAYTSGRLASVTVSTHDGTQWVATGDSVAYSYYGVGEDHGAEGDLKLVTVTVPSDDPLRPVQRKTYYRYWITEKGTETHDVKLVVQAEGARKFDWGEDGLESPPVLDDGFTGSLVTDETLKPFSDLYATYAVDGRLSTVVFDGDCGCATPVAGEYTFTYSSQTPSSSGYEAGWMLRTQVSPPAGSSSDRAELVQYFDETHQPLSRVRIEGSPASPTKFWADHVVRNATSAQGTGTIAARHWPANILTYTHSTGAFATDPSIGLVRHYERVDESDMNIGHLAGLVSAVRFTDGDISTGGIYEVAHAWDSVSMTVGDADLVRPLLTANRDYHEFSTSLATGYDETQYQYAFYTSDAALMWKTRTTTLPTVPWTSNGSGQTEQRVAYVRTDGTVAFERAADGILTYYGMRNGLLERKIRDAQTDDANEFFAADAPSGFGIASSSAGLHLVAEYERDEHGRLHREIRPHDERDAVTHEPIEWREYFRSRLDDGREVVFDIPLVQQSGVDCLYHDPVSYMVLSLSGRAEVDAKLAWSTGAAGTTTTPPSGWLVAAGQGPADDPITAVVHGELVRLKTTVHSSAGARVVEERTYHTIPASGEGLNETNYDRTAYSYDELGRLHCMTTFDGTVTRIVREPRGLPIERWVGTEDNACDQPRGTDSSLVWIGTYDGEGSGGDGSGPGSGHATSSDCWVLVERTTLTETTMYRAPRSEVLLVTNPDAPDVFIARDNLGRIVAEGLYDNASWTSFGGQDPRTYATGRLALTEYFYDGRGRVWKTVVHKVDDQGDLVPGEQLESLTWYDAEDRVIKRQGEVFEKIRHDRLGRQTRRFVLATSDDASYTDVADATSLAGEKVLEEHQVIYDAPSGQVLASAVLRRHHDDVTTTGALDLNTDADADKLTAADLVGRLQVTAYWYDELWRPRTLADYGTNGALTFNRAALTEPTASSATVLVRLAAYYGAGDLVSVTDAAGRVLRFEYDDAGRQVTHIENYVDGTPGGGVDNDEDRVTRFVYQHVTGPGYVRQVIADLPAPALDQVTTYTYGTTKNPHELAAGHLLREIAYPDSSGASDTVRYTYNLASLPRTRTDQAGNVLTFTYDEARRETLRALTSAPLPDFDNTVQLIATRYNARGLMEAVTQYDAADAIDEVRFEYDGWGGLELLEQQQGMVLGAGGYEYDVGFSTDRATAGRRTLRRTAMEYPDGWDLEYTYSSTNSLDDAANRVSGLDLSSLPTWPGVTVAEYEYLGLDQLVGTVLPQPKVSSRHHSPAAFGNDPYVHRDRFDRITRSAWARDLPTPRSFVDLPVAYDANGNVTSVQDLVLDRYDTTTTPATRRRTFDALFEIDGLDRVVDAREGNLSGGVISDQSVQESWTLSPTGNWLAFGRTPTASIFPNEAAISETGTFNGVNEHTARNNGAINDTPVYDAVGNLRSYIEPESGIGRELKYDVFGRLTEAKTGSGTLLAEYRYNGLNQRIAWHQDADSDGDVDANDPWYHQVFDDQGRAIAVYREGDASPKERFVFHAAGLDGLGGSGLLNSVVLRDRDNSTAWNAASDGTLEDRKYYCQNWRGDVVALLTDSGRVSEWVKYSAYGLPYLVVFTDMDLDGDTDGADKDNYYDRWDAAGKSGVYDVRVDTDLDGVITKTDHTLFLDQYLMYAPGGRGLLSRTDALGQNHNRLGFAGYQWDAVLGLYGTQNRWFDPRSGRWASRDQLGYVDGINLYEYVRSRPIAMVDPLGLSSDDKKAPPAAPAPGTVPIAPGAVPGPPIDPKLLGPGGLITHPRHGWRPTGHSAFYVRDTRCPSGYRVGSQGLNGFWDGDLGDYLRNRSNSETIYIDPIRDIDPRTGNDAIDRMNEEDPSYRSNTKCNDVVCDLIHESTEGQYTPAGGGVASPEKLRDKVKQEYPDDGQVYPPNSRPAPTNPPPPP